MRHKQREAWKDTLPRLTMLDSLVLYAYLTLIGTSLHLPLRGYNTRYW